MVSLKWYIALDNWFTLMLSVSYEWNYWKLTFDLFVEGISDWEATYTQYAAYPLIHLRLFEDPNYYLNIGSGFDGIVHSVEFITFTGDVPITRDYSMRNK